MLLNKFFTKIENTTINSIIQQIPSLLTDKETMLKSFEPTV